MMHQTISFANPHAAYVQRRDEILASVARVFDSGRYVLGSEVEDFESEFGNLLGVPFVASCGNGTDAIELALRALGIGQGMAVFTVSHTAVATVAAIECAGAIPVLVDIDDGSFTMSPESLQVAIENLSKSSELKPAAVIPVHLYGHPCDMDPILTLAARYDLTVIEDCAQAHGAKYKGKTVGTLGRAGTFSFYPTKNLGALGDGGAVATYEEPLAKRLKSLRQYAWEKRYISEGPGINSRLDPVQAAILRIQLRHLADDNAARRRIAGVYNRELADTGLILPAANDWAEPVYHLYVVRCPEGRDELITFLRDRGIGTAIHYPMPVHMQPGYQGRIPLSPDGLPVTESVASQIVSLPMYPQLEDCDMDRVCNAVREWAKAGS